MDARRAAELAARNSYGRLVAYLAVRSQDVAAAEDALGDAFLAALKTWPENGVPKNPEAWLLVSARRRLIDDARHAKVKDSAFATLKLMATQLQSEVTLEVPFPDDRLKLLFICAHPAINISVRTPLMLQTVLGFNAAQIASAFLVAPATMSQRLVRAKAKIRDAGIDFELPESGELPTRLDAVLEAIYAAYSNGWDDLAGTDPRRKGLAEEAIWLARLCVQLMPEEPEARGYCPSCCTAKRVEMPAEQLVARMFPFRSRTLRYGRSPYLNRQNMSLRKRQPSKTRTVSARSCYSVNPCTTGSDRTY